MFKKLKKYIFTPILRIASSLIAWMIKCKKYPVITIFVVAISTLIVWMIKCKKYPVITIPSINFTKWVYFLGGIFIFFLVMLILSTRKWGEKTKNSQSIVTGDEKGDKGKKSTWGKKIWYYIFIVIPISGLLLVYALIPVGIKVYVSVSEIFSTNSYEGTYSWKKPENLAGYNPGFRSFGPVGVNIKLSKDGKKISIVVPEPNKYYLHGNKIDGQWDSRRKFSGDWHCPKRGIGGTFEIEETSNQSGVFEGTQTDQRKETVFNRLVINN